MAKFRRKGMFKKVIAGALAVVLGIGAVAGVSSLINKADDDGKVKVNPSYSIGGLDENGKYVESDATLYTKDAFECQGLSIKPDFDSNVKYQIFFYDEVGQFIESTDVMTTTYKDEIPFFATHARLEVTPIWGEDVKEKDQVIKWYNKHQFESSLEIKVSEDQTWVRENLFEVDSEHIGYFRTLNGGSGNYSVAADMGVAMPIDVRNVKKVMFVYNTPSENSMYTIEKADGTGTSAQTGVGLSELVIDIPEGSELMYVGYKLGCEFVVYAIE